MRQNSGHGFFFQLAPEWI